jgi:hypothetical protein
MQKTRIIYEIRKVTLFINIAHLKKKVKEDYECSSMVEHLSSTRKDLGVNPQHHKMREGGREEGEKGKGREK